MMRRINKWIFFVITLVILFSIPITAIISNYIALKDGTEFNFKVMAFDPYDMFRGNYLSINFEETKTHEKYYSDILEKHNSNATYVTIREGYDGFAYFDEVYTEKPENTINYYKTNARYSEYNNSYYIDTPNRYYMNENKSLDAEKIYDENIDNTYVKVRVKDGTMTIVGIYVNDVLIDSMEYNEK